MGANGLVVASLMSVSVVALACSQNLDAIGTGGAGGSGSHASSAGHATSTSASSSISSSSVASSGAGGAGPAHAKRGIAYGHHSLEDLQALSAGVGWWYDWTTHPDDTLMGKAPPAGVEFVPMVWGGTFDVKDVVQKIPAGAKYLLTFNEPNFGNQANLTPQQAAKLWPQIEDIANQRGLSIVSPAPNYCGGNCNETSPYDWLDKFFAACQGCRVDYVAFHWYACYKSTLQDKLGLYHKYNKPLWVTEMSCLDDAMIDDAKESAYMVDAVSVLEADPMVFRYAWFTGRFDQRPVVNLLAPASGTLTALGQQYVGLPSP